MSKHTLSVLVENKPGVLARVSGLFSRRGFNIDSLAVGETEHPEVSRITIVVNVEASPLDRIWGIGLAADDERALDPARWRGLNLLGFALMEARDRLRQGEAPGGAWGDAPGEA